MATLKNGRSRLDPGMLIYRIPLRSRGPLTRCNSIIQGSHLAILVLSYVVTYGEKCPKNECPKILRYLAIFHFFISTSHNFKNTYTTMPMSYTTTTRPYSPRRSSKKTSRVARLERKVLNPHYKKELKYLDGVFELNNTFSSPISLIRTIGTASGMPTLSRKSHIKRVQVSYAYQLNLVDNGNTPWHTHLLRLKKPFTGTYGNPQNFEVTHDPEYMQLLRSHHSDSPGVNQHNGSFDAGTGAVQTTKTVNWDVNFGRSPRLLEYDSISSDGVTADPTSVITTGDILFHANDPAAAFPIVPIQIVFRIWYYDD